MAKFTVRRIVDAYAFAEAEVEAENAEAAAEYARHNEDELTWGEEDTETFDARAFVTLDEDGDPIEETQTGRL